MHSAVASGKTFLSSRVWWIVMVRRTMFSAWQGTFLPGSFYCLAVSFVNPALCRQEATMDLSLRLNVLAALVSFGFIAAIVFGMV